jgi:hypothetical protein
MAANQFNSTDAKAKNLLSDIVKSCVPGSLECSFNYTAVKSGGKVLVPIAPASNFVHDAYYQRFQVSSGIVGLNSPYKSSLAPVSAEVVVCATVPVLAGIPFIGTKFPGPTFTVVGRGAARSIPSVQEWFVPGSPTPGGSTGMFTPLAGIGLQPYEPAPGADALASDSLQAFWQPTGAPDTRAADSFNVDFAGFPVWNNAGANSGGGGYSRTYAPGTFMPADAGPDFQTRTHLGSVPYSHFSAFVTWWSTARQKTAPRALVQGVDYKC